MMNSSALYAEGGYFYNYVYSWRGKLEINHGLSQVGSDLEVSSGPTFCQKGILHEIVAPCPNPVNGCSYCKAFLKLG